MKLSNKIYSISIILIAIILVSACSKKPDIEYTAPYKFAGEAVLALETFDIALKARLAISTSNFATKGH